MKHNDQLHCDGWWEQHGLGRQPMENLRLRFQTGSITGSGSDIVGPFTLTGRLDGQNVLLVKQYLGKHWVRYTGTYDGEGAMYGLWWLGYFGGRWMIAIKSRPGEDALEYGAEVPEWTPSGNVP